MTIDECIEALQNIKNLSVMLFELDVDALVPFRSRTNTFTHLTKVLLTLLSPIPLRWQSAEL